MIENKNKEARFQKNKSFAQKYHDDVVSSGRIGSDPNVSGDITMFLTGVEIDGKEYVIPLYNPMTGKIEGDPYQMERDGEMKTFYKPTREAIERARGYIRDGLIVGYENPQDAESDRALYYDQVVGK